MVACAPPLPRREARLRRGDAAGPASRGAVARRVPCRAGQAGGGDDADRRPVRRGYRRIRRWRRRCGRWPGSPGTRSGGGSRPARCRSCPLWTIRIRWSGTASRSSRPGPATDVQSAVAAAEALGYPVALKLADPAAAPPHRPRRGTARPARRRRRPRRVPGADPAQRGRRLGDVPTMPAGSSCSRWCRPASPSWSRRCRIRGSGRWSGFGPGGVTGELLDDLAWRVAPLTDRDAAAPGPRAEIGRRCCSVTGAPARCPWRTWRTCCCASAG